MSYDWKTLITVSSSDDGWVNPNGVSGLKTNIVRDVIMLPYGEHKSIAIWVQETPGVYTGTIPNAIYRPSLRLKAAVINQTRVADQAIPTSAQTAIGEATSFDNSGTLNIALQYGPIQAVMMRDDKNGNAAFVVTFDWGTQNTSGSTIATHHQLIYCKVTNSAITVLQTYEDSAQSAGTTKTGIIVKAGTDRAVWFKSKTGGNQQTAKIITTSSSSSTMTIGADQDLPVAHTTMNGYLGWQGQTYGFIYDALSAPSTVQVYTLPASSSTITFSSDLTPIPRTSLTNIKLLAGQRLQTSGTDSFAAVGVVESFATPSDPGGGFGSYDPNAPYNNSEQYDSAALPQLPTESVGSYDDPESYDIADTYDNTNNGGGGGSQVLDPFPRVVNISFSGGVFSVLSESAAGQLYRSDAIAGSDIILGTGVTPQSSYQVSAIANAIAVADSAYDALTPIAANRFFGQEVQFDPTTAPVRMTYPSTLTPFSGKYANNNQQISVGLSLVNSGAFVAYVAPSVIDTALDRPLRITYFEHQFTTSLTPAFPTDPPDDHNGWFTDPTQQTVKNLFGATYPARTVCLDADIDLNGLLLNTIDSSGVLWMCTGIEGWWTTPDAATTDIERGQRDGSFDADGRYAARIITVNGVFLPPDRSYVRPARERLIKAINIARDSGYLRTSDDGYKRQSEVWLSGKPEIETVNQKGRTEFSIGLKASDPLKYEFISADPSVNFRTGQTTLTAVVAGRTYNKTYNYDYNFDVENPTGAISVINYGNDIVYPTIEVKGPLASNARVVNSTTGQEFRIVTPVKASETLSVDSRRAAVFLDNIANYRSMLSIDSDWIHLVPGNNSVQLIGTNTGAPGDAPPRLIVKWRSGWIG